MIRLFRRSGFVSREYPFAKSGTLKIETITILIGKEGAIMANGVVKWFDERKGYGFIEQESGGDVFVHHTGISGTGFKTLHEGDRVSFEVEQGQKGPAATNVKVI